MKKYWLVKVMFGREQYCISIGIIMHKWDINHYDINCIKTLYKEKIDRVPNGCYTVRQENMLENSDSIKELRELAMLHIL